MNRMNSISPPSYEEAIKGLDITQIRIMNSLPPQTTEVTQRNATVKSHPNFKVKEDVRTLNDAIMREDCGVVLQILCHRSHSQRVEIGQFYESIHATPITSDLNQYTTPSTKFTALICGLTVPLHEYLARAVHNCETFQWMCYAMIIVPNSVKEAMQRYFVRKYDIEMMPWIKNKVSNNHPDEDILKQITRTTHTTRSESTLIHENEVLDDVAHLVNIQQSRDTIKTMLYTKSFPHIAAVSAEYLKQTDNTIENLVLNTYYKNQFVLLNIINYAINPVNYCAKALKKSMTLVRPMKHLLISILLLRSELDMLDIKAEFESVHNESLKSFIRRWTSGYYKYALYELIGEQRSNK